jgi:cytochrome c biogenesis factor
VRSRVQSEAWSRESFLLGNNVLLRTRKVPSRLNENAVIASSTVHDLKLPRFSVTASEFLTIGIVLGSAWAYYELGWGGWWFWDPVENASFMDKHSARRIRGERVHRYQHAGTHQEGAQQAQ